MVEIRPLVAMVVTIATVVVSQPAIAAAGVLKLNQNRLTLLVDVKLVDQQYYWWLCGEQEFIVFAMDTEYTRSSYS